MTIDDFGPPLAFVRDLGSAMAKAVAACRAPPTPELVCHFPFLAAAGGRLPDADHATLRRDPARWKVHSARRPGLAAVGSKRGTDLAALLDCALEGDGERQPRSRAERPILQWPSYVLEPVRESAFGLTAAAQRLERTQAVATALRDFLRLRHAKLRGRPLHGPLTAASCAEESGRIVGRAPMVGTVRKRSCSTTSTATGSTSSGIL